MAYSYYTYKHHITVYIIISCVQHTDTLSNLSMQHNIYLNTPTNKLPIYSILYCHGYYMQM